MRGDKHLEKAKRIEESQAALDPHTQWEVIVEIVYGAAFNYIAYFCERELEEHLDTHKGLARFLDGKGQTGLASEFRLLEQERAGKWYGGQDDGDTADRVREILVRIKKLVGVP